MTAAEHDQTIQELLSVGLALLDQCLGLLDLLNGPHQLTYTSPVLPGSTIGKHLRHVTDHYALLARAEGHPLQLDYDARSRNGPAESELEPARDSIRDVKQRLCDRAQQWKAEQPVSLYAKTPFEVTVGSTVAREVRLETFFLWDEQGIDDVVTSLALVLLPTWYFLLKESMSAMLINELIEAYEPQLFIIWPSPASWLQNSRSTYLMSLV